MRPSSMKKRQRYLDVATELFLEQGYEATGLDQLIERCGGSKLTLYSYFGDKRGLLKAVVHEVTEQLGEVLKFEATEEEELKNQLVMFACNYMKFIYAPKMLKLSRLVLANNQQEPELVSYFLERGAHHSQSTVLAFLEQQDRLGRLQIDDAFLACEQLLGALKGNRHIEALYTDRVMNEQEMARYAEHAINAFLRSYQ
jgi:TetR/AcrR family transcriptional regulator, mexJK operon transcriptional repressor